MSDIQSRIEEYGCNTIGEVTTVHLNIAVHNGRPVGKVELGECDRARSCGVGIQNAKGGWTYDWTKCEHPHAKK